MDWFEAEGILRFDPRRPGMKNRVKWWCVIEVPGDIACYYRWFIERHWWEADSSPLKRDYHRPPWGAHISVIRGEKPQKNLHLWGKETGRPVRFRYTNWIRQTHNAYYSGEIDRFWFVDVEWDEYHMFRSRFGLSTHRNGNPFRPHMTVARTYD